MNTIEYIKERFDQIRSENGHTVLSTVRRDAMNDFTKLGIPTVKNEEYKYTRISSLFNKEYVLPVATAIPSLTTAEMDAIRLPGHADANELVFINGIFSLAFSKFISSE